MKDLDYLPLSTVLVIDDDPNSLVLFERLLRKNDCGCILTCTNPLEAIALYLDTGPDLVLLDLHMPGMDGVELMQRFRQLDPDGQFVPVIVITNDLDVEAKRQALEAGANDFLDKFSADFEVLLRIRNFLRTRHLHVRIQRHSEDLEQQVFERTKELQATQKEIVQRLATAAEYRDDVTGRHVERVGDMAAELARAVGLDDEEVEIVRLAAKLHDVGKIGIPDAILYKPGALTDEERAIINTHTTIGDSILQGGTPELVRAAHLIARSHHERWDGAGYPNGLAGTDIPLFGRIVAIADVFDALVTERPYKDALPKEVARQIIRENAGTHFDPILVRAFDEIVMRPKKPVPREDPARKSA